MGDPAIGWIAAIIIGGIAGWLAEQFMKSDMGLLMNIALGIVGADGGGRRASDGCGQAGFRLKGSRAST